MSYKAAPYKAYLTLIPLLGVMLPAAETSAQVISADDGVGTQVNTVGDRIDISGGQLSDTHSNLFQSFDQFDVSAGQTANFVTTPDVQNVVGRVHSDQASTINGTLQVSGSDANLYLMNPAGVLIGPEAQLNLNGGFTATTATGIGFDAGQFEAIGEGDYSQLNGDPQTLHFESQDAGAVVNLGDLQTSEGESISLIGGTVVNDGSLSAPTGTVTVAAVENESLVRVSQSNQLLSLEVSATETDSLTTGGITPTRIGEMLTGSGLAHATTLVTNSDGSVSLGTGQPNSHESVLSESGGSAVVSGTISTYGDIGGNINVLGDQVTLSSATLDASGTHGGGLIRVGGDYQGLEAIATATTTTVDTQSRLLANAIDQHNGGRVIVWADQQTQFGGALEATGGRFSGNGGFAEVSGQVNLSFFGSANLSAAQGAWGDLLLDPQNLVITDGLAPPNTSNTEYQSSASVEGILGNVSIEASDHIMIENLSDNELSFAPGTSVTIRADSDGDNIGRFSMSADDAITAPGGSISIFGAGITAGHIRTELSNGASGNITLMSSQDVIAEQISTNNFSFGNNAYNGGDIQITASGGDIVINNLIESWSNAIGNNSGSGGDITLHASGNIEVAGSISSASRANTNAGTGGIIELIADTGNITTGNLSSWSATGGNNASTGGDVSLSAANGHVSITQIDSSSKSGNNRSGVGGNITVDAGSADIGRIDSQSSANNNAQQAGSVNITADGTLALGQITAAAAPSRDGQANSIVLSGNEVDLNGGNNSVTGSSVAIAAADNAQDINLGTDHSTTPGSLTLDISDADLSAIDTSTGTPISIGSTNSTGVVQLFENALTSSTSIDILGGSQLVNASSLNADFLLSDFTTGTLAGTQISFANIEQFAGNSGSQNSISYGFFTGPSLEVDLNNLSNIQTVVGASNSNSTLRGTAGNNIWNITGSDAGTVNGIAFSNFNNLLGSTGSDEFNVVNAGSLSGEIDGNLGSNSLNYNTFGSSVELSIDDVSRATNIGSFQNIGEIVGSSTANDVLNSSDRNDIFTLDPNRARAGQVQSRLTNGNLLSVNFSDIEFLQGQAGDDTFYANGLANASEIVVRGNGGGTTGPQAADRLITDTVETTWVITGEDSGRLQQAQTTLVDFQEISHIQNTATAGGAHQVRFTQPLAQVTGSIDSGSRSLSLIGDAIQIGQPNMGGVIGGEGQLSIHSENSGVAIELGGNGTLNPNSLHLSEGILNAIQPGFDEIIIGSSSHVGGIRLVDGVSFREAVVLRSQGNIEAEITADGSRAGIVADKQVAIESSAGQIQIGEIQTDGGDVSLQSAGSIEIEFIDARGTSTNAPEASVLIDTPQTFTALASPVDTQASIVTNGAQNSTIRILHGNSGQPAIPFTLGGISGNGTVGRIETAAATLVNSPLLAAYAAVGNIELINRGIQPPSEPVINANEVSAATSSELPAIPYSLATSEAARLSEIFTQIETGVSANFTDYLGLNRQNREQPVATLPEIQDTLSRVSETRGIQPAIVYAYFVPDAASEDSVVLSRERSQRPDDQLEVIVVTQTGEPIRQRRWGVTRAQIDEANQTLRQQITSQFSSARQYLPPAQQLYDWIIRPIEQTLEQQEINSIGFVMDTGMRMLPLATLHDGEQYLVENYSLGLLPTFSLTNFSERLGGSDRTNFANASILAMGASRFENQPDLPAVRAEIDLLTSERWEGDAFLNEEFVLENLQTQLQQKDYDIVHLATHAVFEAGSLDNSYIQLWDEQLSLTKMEESLHLSEDNIGLIILSACSTALGDAAAEYGFAGFALNAGSQSALASLWPVNDEGTLGFMSQFYTQLESAPIRAGALQQAQISLIRGEVGITDGSVYGPNGETIATLTELAESGRWDFSHPSFWSAFTMIGNPW